MIDAFGPGILVATRTDIANATPYNIGNAQEFSFDFKANVKELFGQNQLPLDVARGTVKVSGKIKAALISGYAWNTLFFGANFQSGGWKWNPSEAQSVPGSSTYTITPTNAATFEADLGVVYAASGLPLTRVASVAAIGQYSVNTSTGVYTFYSADASAAVLISYTSTVTTGQTLLLTNTLIGTSPTFKLDYYTTRGGQSFIARLNQAQAASINLATKLEDFLMPEIDVSMYADAAGNLGKLVYSQNV